MVQNCLCFTVRESDNKLVTTCPRVNHAALK